MLDKERLAFIKLKMENDEREKKADEQGKYPTDRIRIYL
jgi:hypothetical protein